MANKKTPPGGNIFLKHLATAVITTAALVSSGYAHADLGAALGSAGAQQATNLAPSADASTFGASATTGSNPAGGSTQASGSATASTTINCAQGIFKDNLAAYPLGIETECGANTSGSTPQFVFRVCPQTANGGTCSSSDWLVSYIAVGQSYSFSSNLSLKVDSCNSANTSCQIEVTSSGSFSGNGDSLTSQGQTAMQNQNADSGSITSSVTGTGVYTNTGTPIYGGKNSNSGAYAGGLVSNGGWLTSCFDTQRNQLDGGKDVFTCDNSQSVNFGNQACTNTQTCLQWATTTTSYTTSCQQTVQDSSLNCEKKTPNFQCTLKNTVQNESCAVDKIPTVTATTVRNCSPGQTIATLGDQSTLNTSNSLYWFDITRNGTAFGPPVASVTCDGAGNLVINGVQFNSYESSGTYTGATNYFGTTVYIDGNGNGSGSGLAVSYSIFDDHNCGSGMCPSNMLRTYININCTNGSCTFSPSWGYGPAFMCNAAGVSIGQQTSHPRFGFGSTYYTANGCNSGGPSPSFGFQLLRKTYTITSTSTNDGCTPYE